MSWVLSWEWQQVTSLSKQYTSVAISVSVQREERKKDLNVCLPQQFKGPNASKTDINISNKAHWLSSQIFPKGLEGKRCSALISTTGFLQGRLLHHEVRNTPANNRPSCFLIFFVRLGKAQKQPLLLYFGIFAIDPSCSQIPQSCRNIKENCTTLHQNFTVWASIQVSFVSSKGWSWLE